MLRRGLVVLLLGSLLAARASAAGAAALRAMVATDHELASREAARVLKEGGTPMDAAVTAALVLGVVNPQSSGLGGGGFLLYHDAATRKTYALEYRDRAPAGTAKLLASGARKPRRDGGLAAAAPCEIVGLEAGWKRFGKLPWKRLVEPAIRLARDGFPTGRLLAQMTRTYLETDRRYPELDRLVTGPGDEPMEEGEIFWQPDLARTLERIAREGSGAMTGGPIARSIVLTVNGHGGRMSLEDLAAARAHWVEPLEATYRGYEVAAMPPPASGASVLMALRLFEPVPAGSLGPRAPGAVASLAKALQAGVRAKLLYLGDPAFSEIPLGHFLRGEEPPAREEDAAGEDVEPEEHTTHVSVMDAKGNAVAMTSSLGASYGCRLVAPGTGVVLSNHSADFSPAAFEPNAYGVRYGPANVVAPGKAAVSGATPLIFTRDGKPRLAIGGSGSARIPPAVTQCVVNVLDHGMTPARAVSAPRFQVTMRSKAVWVEERFPEQVRRGLELRGIRVKKGVKRASVTAVEAWGGKLLGGSDPRKHGQPEGY